MNNETKGFTGFELFLVGVLIIISIFPLMVGAHIAKTGNERQRLANYVNCVKNSQSTETCMSVDDLIDD